MHLAKNGALSTSPIFVKFNQEVLVSAIRALGLCFEAAEVSELLPLEEIINTLSAPKK
jgi:hypothetical protein